MFKNIPGNHNYVISLSTEIRQKDGNKSDLKEENGLVQIDLYKKIVSVDKKWLSLISHYEVDLPDHLKSINFIESNHKTTKSTTGYLMVFNKPILIDNKYRIIPNYTRYAISKEGEIIDLNNNNKIIKIYTNKTEYPYSSIYNPEKNNYVKTTIHRLVALAWCMNNDFISKPIVNHKDGNKSNYHYRNLEWCSYKENNRHAIDNDLIGNTRQCKVKDHETGEVTLYKTFIEACNQIGLARLTKIENVLNRKVTKLIRNRYEVKEANDETPWLENIEKGKKLTKYTITVKYKDGTVDVFYNIVDLMRRLKIWNISYNIKEIISVAKNKYPGINIEYVDNFPVREVQALNVKTGEILTADSISKLSILTNCSQNTIRKAINSGHNYLSKDYIFRYKSDESWDSNYKIMPNRKQIILVENIDTKEIMEFPSIKDACICLNVMFQTLKYSLVNNVLLKKKWKVSYKDLAPLIGND